MLRQFL
jgi:hypothetical protein